MHDAPLTGLTQRFPDDPAPRLMGSFLRVLKEHRRRRAAAGLRPHEFWILHAIVALEGPDGRGPRSSELSELLRVSPPTVSQQIDDLERRGAVERRRDPEDRRSVRLSLSPEGRALLERHREEGLSFFSEIAGHLGPDRASALADLLEETADFLEVPR